MHRRYQAGYNFILQLWTTTRRCSLTVIIAMMCLHASVSTQMGIYVCQLQWRFLNMYLHNSGKNQVHVLTIEETSETIEECLSRKWRILKYHLNHSLIRWPKDWRGGTLHNSVQKCEHISNYVLFYGSTDGKTSFVINLLFTIASVTGILLFPPSITSNFALRRCISISTSHRMKFHLHKSVVSKLA